MPRADTPSHLTLTTGPWLTDRLAQRIFAAVAAAGGEARIIGGAVRNALLGVPVADIDMASTLVPEQLIDSVTRAGLTPHPTGLDHGTITVAGEGGAIEVTTLRRDVETDGRRAVVAFTTDWHEDAQRRDFTINALSADAQGRVFDSVGGLADIAARRVRFIGTAEARIREDYLRILRFFRFTSAYAAGPCEGEGLAAATRLSAGLQTLSAERVGDELMKFIVTPRAGEIAEVMQAHGIFAALFRDSGSLHAMPQRLQRLQAIEHALADTPDAITRLAALFVNSSTDVIELGRRLRLSNADIAAMSDGMTTVTELSPKAGQAAAKAALYYAGRPAFDRRVRLAWANTNLPADDAAWHKIAQLPRRWTAPKLPFTGDDVLALGIAAGPRVGRTLRAFETWWVQEDFPDAADGHRARLAALAAQS